MGTWGPNAWDTDKAAQFFHDALDGAQVDAALERALSDCHDIDSVRAGAYLLGVLGVSYMWPGDLERLQRHIERAHVLLSAFLDPSTSAGQAFDELCGLDSEYAVRVRHELEALERFRR